MQLPEGALDVARQVLTGQINRATLLENWKTGDNPTHVVVMVALILARGEDISLTNDDEYVFSKGKSYSTWINELMIAGTGDQRSAPARGRRAPTALIKASQAMGMHQAVGGGSSPRVCLAPPQSLVRLAAEHADNPAVQVFFEDAAAALKAEQKAIEQFRASRNINP